MVQFTKKAIIETFIEMLNQMPLDKITVKDIVNNCGINRNTFYYYYQDIYALLEDIISAEIDKVVNESGGFDSWIEGCKLAIRFCLENKKAVYHIYNSLSKDVIDRYLNSVLDYFMKEYIKQEIQGLTVDERDVMIISMFYRSALLGLIFDWIGQGMKADAVELLDRLGFIFDGCVRQSLLKASKDNSDI